MDVGVLLLRLVVGLTMAAHGGQKLFGWFRGPGREGFRGYLASLGFGRAPWLVWVAGGAELLGGALFAAGLLTPLAAAALIGVMVAAALIVHAPHGFFASDGGYELPLLIGAVAVAVTVAGPGAYALDALLDLGMTGPRWAAAGIGLGLAAGLATAGAHRYENRTSERVRTA